MASNLIISDNFNEQSTSNWETYGNSSGWNIQPTSDGGYEYVGTTSPETKSIFSIFKSDGWENSIFQVDVNNSFGVDKIILFRVTNNFDCYALNLRSSFDTNQGNDIYLYKTNLFNSADKFLVPPQRISVENNVGSTYTIQVSTENISTAVKIIVKINGNEVINITDNDSPILKGSVGLYVYPSGIGAVSHFDNVKISDNSGDISLNVPSLMQTNPIWANEKYDHANKWALGNNTISRWGCALTSATMVLNYFGFTINVSELNNWLIEQPDGYVRNGLLNWLAISRYSKQHDKGYLPSLEYVQYKKSENIDQSLSENLPVIIGQNHHFFVVKGSSNNNYLINDPFFNTTSYEFTNTPDLSIGKYIPSNTDLSYIMLVTSSNINLSIFNQDFDLIIPTNNISDNYINPDQIPPNQEFLESLNIYLIPKPSFPNNYFIQINNPEENYFVEIYLYDTFGNVYINKINGIPVYTENKIIYRIYFSDFIKKVIPDYSNIISFINFLIRNNATNNVGYINSILIRIKISERFLIEGQIDHAIKFLDNIQNELKIKNDKIISHEIKNNLFSLIELLKIQALSTK